MTYDSQEKSKIEHTFDYFQSLCYAAEIWDMFSPKNHACVVTQKGQLCGDKKNCHVDRWPTRGGYGLRLEVRFL